MASGEPNLTQARDALWAAEKAVEQTQRDHGIDVAGTGFTGNFMHVMHSLAVYAAMAGGELSTAACGAINGIFWGADGFQDPLAERDALLADPELAKQAISYALSCVRVLHVYGPSDQRSPDRNLMVRAVDLILQAVIAADTNAPPEIDRMTGITTELRQTVLDMAAPAKTRRVRHATRKADPVPPPPASAEPAAPEETVASILAELDQLVGLKGVKHEVGTLLNLAKVFAIRRTMGIPVPDMSLHLVFLGNPGTGKTTVARIVARLYGKLGLLSKGQLVEVDRSGLVANYVGQTATKVEAVVQSALGGVLFIDEAYALDGGDQNDFGQEAVATLLKAMEDHRRDLVVIAAGYTDQMHWFLDMNPGLRSRLCRDIAFEDYTPGDMAAIFRLMASGSSFVLPADADAVLGPVFQAMWDTRGKEFANARDVRNLFERVVEAQANRVGALATPTETDVRTITAQDLIAGSAAGAG